MTSFNIEMEPWISATQISTFELCNRKWAWRWLEGVKAPPNKFAQLGIDTHGKLEKWLRSNAVPEMEKSHADGEHRKRDEQAVKLAQAMIPYLPPPQAVDPNNVERDELIFVQDVLFIVKIDLFMPEMVSWDGVVRPRTCDHKTTGDFKWMPEVKDLHLDAQAALYTAWTIIHTKQTEIDLQWNYVRTKGAIKVEPLCATVTDAMITPRMLANVETGRQVKKLLGLKDQGLRALDVVHDARACDEYGGCPYRERCGISGRERIVSIMSDFKNQPATQQFLQTLGPQNGQAVNPPAFVPQGAPQQPGGFAPPQQPQGGFAPPQQPGGFAPPAAQPPQGFAPPQQPPQAPTVLQQAQPTQPEPAKGPGRPKNPKEYDLTGAWAVLMSGALVVCAGDTSRAAQLADAALQELKARQ